MEHRKLGPSELSVSVLGLGTMTFGAESDEVESHAVLDRFAEAGGTFIDTADVYSAGASEEIVGRWLARQADRDRYAIATKGRFAMGDGPEDSGASRAHLTRALEESLRRLGVETVDLYQVHCWDPDTALEETLETLDGFVTSGKARHVGVSNYTGAQFARAATTVRLSGLAPIVSLQAQYSLLERTIELELTPTCIEEGISLLPWSPLGGGWLSGKYSPDQRPTGATRLGEDPTRGVEAYDLRNTQHTWDVIEECSAVAAAHDVPMAAVAIAWLKQRPMVSSVILGARTVHQLEQNLIGGGLVLSADDIERLDRVSAPGMALYPYGFVERYGGDTTWEMLATRSVPPPIGA